MVMLPKKFVGPLSPITLDWILKIERSNLERPRVRNRAQAIRLSHQGYPAKEIAKICQVTAETVRSWVDTWERQGIDSLWDAPRCGRTPLISEDHYEDILAIFKEESEPYQTKRILRKVEDRLGVRISSKTLKRILKKLSLNI